MMALVIVKPLATKPSLIKKLKIEFLTTNQAFVDHYDAHQP